MNVLSKNWYFTKPPNSAFTITFDKSFSLNNNAKHFQTVPVVKRNLKLTPISLMDGGKIKLSNVYILFKLTAWHSRPLLYCCHGENDQPWQTCLEKVPSETGPSEGSSPPPRFIMSSSDQITNPNFTNISQFWAGEKNNHFLLVKKKRIRPIRVFSFHFEQLEKS